MEIVLLGLLAVLLFGAKNLPSIGRSVGRGVRDFRQSVDGTGIKDALDGMEPGARRGQPDEPRQGVRPRSRRHPGRGLGLEGGAAARRRGRCGGHRGCTGACEAAGRSAAGGVLSPSAPARRV